MRNYSRTFAKATVFSVMLVILLGFFASNVYAYSPSTHRIAGLNRYETAANIAKEGWPSGSSWVVLAYGQNFPDALAATPLAAKYDAPILLTEEHTLTPITKDTLIALGTKNVIIVGGPGVVSPTVEGQLQGMSISTKRLWGNDRYDTSVAIADEVGAQENKLIVTTGDNFPDALSISPFAGNKKIPIVLVSRDHINDSLKQFLANHNIQQTYMIGNSNEISDSVKSLFPNATRIQGTDKYDTNLAVLNSSEPDYNFDNTFLATGNDFADALAGSAYAAKTGAPIILIDGTLDNRIAGYLAVKNPQIKQLNILGGEGVMPSSLIENYINQSKPTYSPSELAKLVSPSVVYIEIYDKSGKAIATGSGFIVDANGKIATNYHVIKGAYSAQVKTYNGEIYDVAKVFAYDVARDMALIKINATGLKPVILGDSDNIATGDKIYTIGNPMGLDYTISDGLISTKSRIVDDATYIQISAPISHGSSGGVLVNEQAETIGITSAGIDEGQNLNFAIPINLLKPMLTQDINKTLPQITDENPSKMTYSDFGNYIKSKFGSYKVGDYTLSFSTISVGEFPDGGLRVSLTTKIPEDTEWLKVGLSDVNKLNQYVLSILLEAETVYPDLKNDILVSVWFSDDFQFYPSAYPSKEITYVSPGVWHVLHWRAIADDYSGYPKVTLEPSIN